METSCKTYVISGEMKEIQKNNLTLNLMDSTYIAGFITAKLRIHLLVFLDQSLRICNY